MYQDQDQTKICSQYIRHLMPFCHYIIYSIYPTGSNQRSVMLRLPNRLPPTKGKPKEVDFSHISFFICTYSYYVICIYPFSSSVMLRLPNRLPPTKGKPKEVDFSHISFFICTYSYYVICIYPFSSSVMWRLPNRLPPTKGKRGKWISFTIFLAQSIYIFLGYFVYVCLFIYLSEFNV